MATAKPSKIRPVRPAVPARVAAAGPPEVVDPRWLLKAAGAVVLLGLFCAYLTLCIFFYLGQWQFVLHPSRTVSTTPASQHLAFETVRFGADSSGQPQLTGWWIPGGAGVVRRTVLVLGSGSGNMADNLLLAGILHQSDLNVLLFDYRGFGESLGRHPSESLMHGDAESARNYLLHVRHIPSREVLVAGTGLGASLAVHLCAEHAETPGVLLLDADGDTTSRVEADQRSRILPIRLLFHERFPLADSLHKLQTPKLLISNTRGEAPEVYLRASDPKMTAELPTADSVALQPLLRRFLDQYLPPSSTTLLSP